MILPGAGVTLCTCALLFKEVELQPVDVDYEANDSLLKLAVFPVPCMSSYTLTPSLVLTDYTNIKLSSNMSEMISLVDSFLFPIFVIKCANATFYRSLIDHKTLTLSLSYHAAKCRNIAHSLALC